MKVEQHHLTLQLGERTDITLVVNQFNIDDSRLRHLVGINLHSLLVGSHNTGGFHSLDCDVMQILSTHCSRIESIPTCSNGSKYLNVITVIARIKYQIRTNSLEESEIRRCRLRFLKDIISLHLILIVVNQLGNAVGNNITAERCVLLQTDDRILQCNLLECKSADL